MTGPRVVVIGGGITGLSCAFTLLEEARRLARPVTLTVLEAGAVAGGHARTTLDDGFVVEAGPNGFLNREPQTMALIEALGLRDRLVEARPESKRRFIVRDGRLCQVPDGPAALVSTPALSWRGKLRLVREPFAASAPAGVDETVHAFAARRLGAEAADVLVDTAVSGISAGDSRQLSVGAQFPVLLDMEREHGSLLKAMFRMPRNPAGPARLLSFDHGIGVLSSALVEALAGRVHTGNAARTLRRTADGWRVQTDGDEIEADHVVLAAPSHTAAPLVATFDAALGARLAAIEYGGLAVVALAYRLADVPRTLDGYGYLVTRPEGLATLGVVWESSLFPGRAPEGMALLRVMIGGVRRPDIASLPADEVLTLARQDLRTVLGVTAPPARHWTFAWPRAIAQYTVGHLERRAAIGDAVARHPGLTVCGTAYDGVSFNHAVKSGRLTAHALTEHLWQTRSVPAPLAGVAG